MALQVVSEGVSVYKVLGVKDGQEQTEEYVFPRGELLPDWVSPYQQFVLTNTGMCRQVGDVPDPNLRAAADEPAPVVLPEHAPYAVVGTDVTEPAAVTKRVDVAAGGAPASSARAGELPDEGATKPVWEDYAVNGLPTGSRMERGEAESLKKADLIKEVTARHRQAGAARQEPDDGALPPAFGAPKASKAAAPKA